MGEGMSHFREEELIDIFCGLIQRRSDYPAATEEAAARYVQSILEKNGISAELSWAAEGRPNVIAKIKGNRPGPVLLYNGHLDVVPLGDGWSVEPFACVIKDGKLFGRGAADMKSGVAAMLYAAIVLQRMGNPFAGELTLLFDADEENLNTGMRHFLKEDFTADYAVIGEPSDLDVCIAHKGVGRYWVRTTGTPGHTAYVTDPDNAISKMARLLPALDRLGAVVRTKTDPLLGHASLMVTQISGGKAINIVPDLCKIGIDRRVLPGETREAVLAEITTALQEADQGAGTFAIEDYLFVASSAIAPQHPLVTSLAAISTELRRQKAEVKIFAATCEAPFLSVDKGIPTVIFGPGSLAQAHVADEYVEIRQVIIAAQIYTKLALSLLHGCLSSFESEIGLSVPK